MRSEAIYLCVCVCVCICGGASAAVASEAAQYLCVCVCVCVCVCFQKCELSTAKIIGIVKNKFDKLLLTSNAATRRSRKMKCSFPCGRITWGDRTKECCETSH